MKKQAVRFGAELQDGASESVDLTKHPFELNRQRDDSHADADYRLWRECAMAESAFRAGADRPRRQLVRYMRRVLLLRQGDRRDRRRRLGDGRGAVPDALCHKGHAINRSERFRASKIMLERAMAHPRFSSSRTRPWKRCSGVEEKDVKGLRLQESRHPGKKSIFPVSAMFLGIGHVPNASAFKGMLDLDEDGYILTQNNVFLTLNGKRLPGVFACGDIQDRRYRQAITAAGSGCMAALEVEKYLEEHGR